MLEDVRVTALPQLGVRVPQDFYLEGNADSNQCEMTDMQSVSRGGAEASVKEFLIKF